MTNIQKEHFDNEYAQAHLSFQPSFLHQTVLATAQKNWPTVPPLVLDIGAGAGHLLKALPAAKKLHAVDISSNAVELLKDSGIQAVQADLDAQTLPYADNTFDRIFCLEVIEHLIRPERALKEMARILKPDGVLCVSVPNIYQLATLLLIPLDIPPINSARYGHIHVNDFTVRVLKKALKDNGLKLTHLSGDEIFPLKDPVTRFIARKLPRLSHHLIAHCEKI